MIFLLSCIWNIWTTIPVAHSYNQLGVLFSKWWKSQTSGCRLCFLLKFRAKGPLQVWVWAGREERGSEGRWETQILQLGGWEGTSKHKHSCIFFSPSSNLLPRVGRGFGKIFKAIQLPGSEQYLRGPPRGSRLARLHVFAGGAHGCGPKSYQITSWELTCNSSRTGQISEKENNQTPGCFVCAPDCNNPFHFNSSLGFVLLQRTTSYIWFPSSQPGEEWGGQAWNIIPISQKKQTRKKEVVGPTSQSLMRPSLGLPA